MRLKSLVSPSRQPEVSLPMSWKTILALGAMPSPASCPPELGPESVRKLSPAIVADVCVPCQLSGLPPQTVLPS
jgi:hypothetical protein